MELIFTKILRGTYNIIYKELLVVYLDLNITVGQGSLNKIESFLIVSTNFASM